MQLGFKQIPNIEIPGEDLITYIIKDENRVLCRYNTLLLYIHYHGHTLKEASRWGQRFNMPGRCYPGKDSEAMWSVSADQFNEFIYVVYRWGPHYEYPKDVKPPVAPDRKKYLMKELALSRDGKLSVSTPWSSLG